MASPSVSALAEWKQRVLADDKTAFRSTVLSSHDMRQAIQVRDVVSALTSQVFSCKISTEGSPVTAQYASGRCWLFAITNVMRVGMMQRLNLDKLRLSPSYLFFYDKLEKCNFFLQNIIETRDQDIDARVVQHFLREPFSDGGQYDFVINLLEKYGVVPYNVYPDSQASRASANLNWLLFTLLRRNAQTLREARSGHDKLRESMVEEIFRVLALTLGIPLGANEQFEWKYHDKDNKFHTLKTTPLQFYRDMTQFDATKHFSLLNDPRNAYNSVLTIDRLGNVAGARPVRYVNVSASMLADTAIKMLKANKPVFFGADSTQFQDREKGIFAPELYDYSAAFGVEVSLQDKASRLQYAQSLMTHAMVFTGVDLDEDGKPLCWRVENSWGDSVGDKGYFTASQKWFEEYVYQIVVSQDDVASDLVEMWHSAKATVLPPWDPCGSLATLH